MDVRFLSFVVSCALASSASALPFQAFQISAGGQPGVQGLPVIVTGGTIHQDPMGDDQPPASTAIGSLPALEYDSYIALDSIGPSTNIYSSAGAMISSPPYAIPGALSGQWGNGGGVPSSVTGLFGVFESVFVSRLVVTAESQVDGQLLVASVIDEGGPLTVMSDLTIVNAFARPSERGGGAEYRFLGLRTLSPFAAHGAGLGGTFDVYDIYLVREIPTPGTLALCGCLLVRAAFRRRSGR